MIIWNGKCSEKLNLHVEKFPDQKKPSRKYNAVSVPGRNGDLIFAEDAFNNVVQIYDIYFNAEKWKLPETAHAVAEWLYNPKGYARLEDDYDPRFYRMAFYTGETDIENIFNLFGRATISFNCKPQKFLKSGERMITMEENGRIINPLGFESLPLITVYGNGEITLNINNNANLLNIENYITIDSETLNAYKRLQNINCNNQMSGEFPKLKPGYNNISWEGNVEKIEIIPRWWTL